MALLFLQSCLKIAAFKSISSSPSDREKKGGERERASE
ncbi:unnamed protein product [Linum tenue]|uniref:Uncharacterized protein n=1 Tax=Linum tenue TaxID=586396 RepID=A0AAV0K2Z7_9ROSI|nr:unnamed protein product [Linum tenue]